MRNLKWNQVKKLKRLAVVSIFMLALFMPVFLCGCGDKTGGDELLLQMNGETQTQSSAILEEETFEDISGRAKTAEIYVYVCGAVQNPDVYRVGAKSRLFEVIEMAGGFTPEADRARLNLARTVTDGEQIVVYTIEETVQGMVSVSENGASALEDSRININTASLRELTGIPGIGESRAQAIIDYREKNGGFGSVEEIKKVDGIKDGLFSKIKDDITI